MAGGSIEVTSDRGRQGIEIIEGDLSCVELNLLLAAFTLLLMVFFAVKNITG